MQEIDSNKNYNFSWLKEKIPYRQCFLPAFLNSNFLKKINQTITFCYNILFYVTFIVDPQGITNST